MIYARTVRVTPKFQVSPCNDLLLASRHSRTECSSVNSSSLYLLRAQITRKRSLRRRSGCLAPEISISHSMGEHDTTRAASGARCRLLCTLVVCCAVPLICAGVLACPVRPQCVAGVVANARRRRGQRKDEGREGTFALAGYGYAALGGCLHYEWPY